jgi:hypothetical protein
VLRVAFAIQSDDPAVERALRFLDQSAQQPEPARCTVSYAVRRRGVGQEITRNGGIEDVQFDPPAVLQALYQRVQRDALSAWPEAAVLKAVTGSAGGERFIVVGETLRDRSRLALTLLSLGADLEGDDLAIIHDGVLTAYPRPLRVCGDDVPLPPSAPARDELPFQGSRRSTGSWVLDLGRAGIEWKVTSGPVHRVILLETNYGGQTRVRDVPRSDAARSLMSSCDPLGHPASAIRGIARLTDNAARCQRLRLGSLDNAATVLW